MGKLIDITGNRYGRLVVIKRSYTDKDKFVRWECKCDCGNTYYGRSYELKNGIVKSCGCLEIENRQHIGKEIHGLSQLPIYKVWKSMKARCYRETDKRYSRYGGRGISVCNEWLHSPEAFIEWANKNGYSKGLSLDRIDNNSNYSPENCRFVSTAINNRNSSNVKLHDMEILKIKELYANGWKQIDIAERFCISQQTVSKIVNDKSWI